MGYYTRYELSIIDGDEFINETSNAITVTGEEVVIVTGSVYIIDAAKQFLTDRTGYEYLFGDDVKWYDHEDDMKALSIKYPNHTFKLSGEGEESGDIWFKYFKNGKIQISKVVMSFDEYDESKLV